MKIHWVAMVAVALLAIVADVYICRRLRRSGHQWLAVANGVLAVLCVAAVTALAVLPLDQASTPNSTFVVGQYLLYGFFLVFVPKVLGLIVDALGRLSRRATVRRVCSSAGVVIALLAALVMLWGALVTPREIEVSEVVLECERLPQAFDGYRIVHWSDAHLGTYNGDTSVMAQWVTLINSLRPDMICFTGDLVSRETAEATPYRKLLSMLHAPDGVYSVLGNHDYDDYALWGSERAMLADREALCELQRQVGWTLLNNSHAVVSRGDDRIVVIGTENWGEHPYDKRGDLIKAYNGLQDGNFKIQLQHNPYAWRANTLTNSNIDVMLAGHTHAWQVMLTVAGHRLSPARLRYREWGGLYTSNGRHLYVNTGVGMVGPPMRIGAVPEVTVITLKCAR